MKELAVLNFDGYKYALGSSHKKLTEITILCKDLKLEVGTKVYIHKELLDKNYSEYNTHYYFGDTQEVYGRTVASLKDIDIIMIDIGKQKIFLKRLFG